MTSVLVRMSISCGSIMPLGGTPCKRRTFMGELCYRYDHGVQQVRKLSEKMGPGRELYRCGTFQGVTVTLKIQPRMPLCGKMLSAITSEFSGMLPLTLVKGQYMNG